jgi:hypothetical protein
LLFDLTCPHPSLFLILSAFAPKPVMSATVETEFNLMESIEIDKQIQDAVTALEPLPLKITSSHALWQQLLRSTDEMKPNNSRAIKKGKPDDVMKGLKECDVVCGRSKLAHSHPGNQQFRLLVQKYRDAYKGAKLRNEKKSITKSVIDAVHRQGGRFLMFDHPDEPTSYEEVSFEYKYEKVSHALRSAKAPNSLECRRQVTPALIESDVSIPLKDPNKPSLELQALRWQPLYQRSLESMNVDELLEAIVDCEDADVYQDVDEDDLHLLIEL